MTVYNLYRVYPHKNNRSVLAKRFRNQERARSAFLALNRRKRKANLMLTAMEIGSAGAERETILYASPRHLPD